MGQIKDKGRLVEYDDKSLEFRNGGRSGLAVANEYFEHFNHGAAIPVGLTQTVTTPVAAATYGLGLGGTTVQTSDDVLATGAVELATFLLWQADRQSVGQPLVFETKVKVGTLAGREFFFGFSDAQTDPNAIALSLTSTFTTSAPSDGVYLGYSDTPTSGAAFTANGNQHVAIGIKANTNTVVATGGGVFETDVYYTYRIEVDSAGGAVFFVNGKVIGSTGAGLTKTVPLCAYMTGIPRASAGSSEAVFTVDYLYVGGK